ncbi:MAG: hypothetical protein IJ228_03355 [Succinivibrio sp.]|nr:hypothetical protein [Succinivibrio sp.]
MKETAQNNEPAEDSDSEYLEYEDCDTIFRDLFTRPENALSLCNALQQTGARYPSDLQIFDRDEDFATSYFPHGYVTVQAGSHLMFLWDHLYPDPRLQALRALKSYADIAEKIIRRCGYDEGYSGKLPLPFFYSFSLLNGDWLPPVQTFKLQEVFMPGLDAGINPQIIRFNILNRDCPLLLKCPVLSEYAELIRRMIQARDDPFITVEETVAETVETCLENGILKDYLDPEDDVRAWILEFELRCIESAWDSFRAGREESRRKAAAKRKVSWEP